MRDCASGTVWIGAKIWSKSIWNCFFWNYCFIWSCSLRAQRTRYVRSKLPCDQIRLTSCKDEFQWWINIDATCANKLHSYRVLHSIYKWGHIHTSLWLRVIFSALGEFKKYEGIAFKNATYRHCCSSCKVSYGCGSERANFWDSLVYFELWKRKE